jgi:AhpD family alkylhydroperoxidase
MQARMKNPIVVLPAAMQPMQALAAVAHGAGVLERTLGLVHMRTSQLNGCAVCLEGHRHLARKLDESEERMFAVAVWRDAPFFNDAERAALGLAEAVTRLGEAGVPDEVWNEAARHYDERALAALVLHIAVVNVWNRLNVATRQVAGEVRWD